MTQTWHPVDECLPERGRAVEMMDEAGVVSHGWWDGRLFRFNHWGTGRAITFWRYAAGLAN